MAGKRYAHLIEGAIRERYEREGAALIARDFGLTPRQVLNVAIRMGYKMDRSRDAEINSAIASRYATEGPTKIMAEFGLSRDAVELRAARACKVSCRGRLRKSLDGVILERYEKEGGKVLGDERGITPALVRRRAREIGIELDRRVLGERISEWKEEFFAKRLDFSHFQPLDSLGAYALGLLWADGNVQNRSREESQKRHAVYSVRIALTPAEWPLLESLAGIFGLPATRVLGPYVRNKGMWSPQGTWIPPENFKPQKYLALGGKRLARMMVEEYGVFPRKSFIDPPFPNIPDVLLGSFARGVLDGDGSCGTQAKTETPVVRFFGSEQFIHELRDRAIRLLGVAPSQPYEANCWEVRWGARNDVMKLTEWMHADRLSDPTYPYAPRKHDPFLAMYREAPRWKRVWRTLVPEGPFSEGDFPLWSLLNRETPLQVP